jgi:imidazolonepropionase-like amidohydrolase
VRRAFIGIALAAVCSCTSTPEVSQATTVIEHVTVIPMDRPGLLVDHSVLISGDRIVSVAPAAGMAIPASATRVNGRGKFLVPGLADMHAHDIEPTDLELYAAAGVTQLRVLAANPLAIALRDERAGGDVFRPSVYVEGLLTDGSPPYSSSRKW